MDAHVVAGGIDPVDGLDIHAMRLVTIANGKSLRIAVLIRSLERVIQCQLTSRQVADKLQQLVALQFTAFLVVVMLRARNRLTQPVVIDWLQEVIERVGLEGLERELVKSRYEDDFRHPASG